MRTYQRTGIRSVIAAIHVTASVKPGCTAKNTAETVANATDSTRHDRNTRDVVSRWMAMLSR